ncbi:hypothetical protein [Streptomyces sp. NPDC056492]|uniref:hypothetical protein n=1 Tax=unclassified Streptomyces TaxID=2593676 RepID=UPI003673F6E4
MYLVHVHLGRHAHGDLLPGHAAADIAASVAGILGIEHIVVHSDARPHPIVGIYLHAKCLRDAESAATDAWMRATVAEPWLRQWEFLRAVAPLPMSDTPW